MSDRDWPADPNDPRCPACGEPVSATATYCLHCYADLPAARSGATAVPGSPAETEAMTVTGTTGRTTTTEGPTTADWSATTDQPESPADQAGTTTWSAPPEREMPTDEPPEALSGWLHPDSAFDDVSTAVVGIVGGALDGFVLLVLGLWLVPSAVHSAGAMAVVGGLLATGWITWTPSVFGAIRKAAYSFAALVALVPPVAAYAEGSPGLLLLGIVAWPIAGLVAGVGWVAGRGALEDGG